MHIITRYASLFLLLALILPSCVNTQKAVYFNNIQDSEIDSDLENLEPVIQKNDLLSISVSSLNPEASQIFNTPNITAAQSSTVTGTTAQVSGYLVDQDGFILFPVLGNIKVAGLTKKAVKEELSKELVKRKLLVDPIVSIRYLNFKVSVLGEVAHPSVHIIPNEKISLLEALGLAGDLTVYSKRDNVLLIREEKGKKIVKRLDLTSNEIFTSPYYYLKSNDIIYVEPNKAKIASAGRANQRVPVILSALSVAVIVLDRLLR